MVDEDTKKQIAVIGDRSFTLGFKLAGVTEVYEPENYRETIEELIQRDDIGILVADENDVHDLPGRVQNKIDSAVDPVVVKLSEDAEDSNLKEEIRKVIGADIG